jgi:NAD-dependent deacetylase
MIEKAADITATADIFAVVGTSLLVYPAAGLVHYKPSHVPCYLVDKRLPDVSHVRNVISIEQPATKGVAQMKERLMQLL